MPTTTIRTKITNNLRNATASGSITKELHAEIEEDICTAIDDLAAASVLFATGDITFTSSRTVYGTLSANATVTYNIPDGCSVSGIISGSGVLTINGNEVTIPDEGDLWFVLTRVATGYKLITNNQSSVVVPPTYEAESITYFDAIAAAGASITFPEKVAYDSFVKREKAAGKYSDLQVVYPFIGSLESAKINAVDPGNMDISAYTPGISKTAAGIASSGATGQKATTGVRPSDLTLNSNCMVFATPDFYGAGAGSGTAIAAYDSVDDNSIIRISVYGSNAAIADMIKSSTVITDVPAWGSSPYRKGVFGVSRTASGEFRFVRPEGVTTHSVSSVTPQSNEYITLFNLGSVDHPWQGSLSLVFFGLGKDGSELVRFRTSINTLINDLGR